MPRLSKMYRIEYHHPETGWHKNRRTFYTYIQALDVAENQEQAFRIVPTKKMVPLPRLNPNEEAK